MYKKLAKIGRYFQMLMIKITKSDKIRPLTFIYLEDLKILFYTLQNQFCLISIYSKFPGFHFLSSSTPDIKRSLG